LPPKLTNEFVEIWARTIPFNLENWKIGKIYWQKIYNFTCHTFLLSFPQILSVGAVILHEVPQCTQNLIRLTKLQKCLGKNAFYALNKSWQKSRKKEKVSLQGTKSIFFWRLVNKIRKKCMCIVVLNVKLQPQRKKSVEMRAKFVWQVKIIDFFNVFFLFFNFWG
jgi:hypothetical protein